MGEMSGYVMRGSWVAPLIRAIETYDISASQLLAEEVSDEEIEHVEMLQAEIAKLPESARDDGDFDVDDTPYL